jgi:hypothetical protein
LNSFTCVINSSILALELCVTVSRFVAMQLLILML